LHKAIVLIKDVFVYLV